MDSWRTDLNKEIDELLRLYRPDRYSPSDRKWQQPVVDLVRRRIAEEPHLVGVVVEKWVADRERRAPTDAHLYVRRWDAGQAPLDLEWLGPLPIVANKLRMRISAASLIDIDDAAHELMRKAKVNFDGQMKGAFAWRDLVKAARGAGHLSVIQLGLLAPRGDDRAIASFYDEDGLVEPYDGDDGDDD